MRQAQWSLTSPSHCVLLLPRSPARCSPVRAAAAVEVALRARSGRGLVAGRPLASSSIGRLPRAAIRERACRPKSGSEDILAGDQQNLELAVAPTRTGEMSQ